jgi:hypothetical protein
VLRIGPESSVGAGRVGATRHPAGGLPYPRSWPQASKETRSVWVNKDFYAQLTHDASVRYPEKLEVPECPPASPEPGFASGQDVPDEVLDSALTCAVHPRFAVTELLMVTDSANSFSRHTTAAAAPTTCANGRICRDEIGQEPKAAPERQP